MADAADGGDAEPRVDGDPEEEEEEEEEEMQGESPWEVQDILEKHQIAAMGRAQDEALLQVLGVTGHFDDLEAPDKVVELGADGTVSRPFAVDEDDDDDDGDAFDASAVEPMSAFSLTSAEVMAELQKRGMAAKGFFNDDAKTLQKLFDDEHEARVESLRETHLARIRESKLQKARHRHRIVIHRKLREEAETIVADADEQLCAWLKLVARDGTPRDVCLGAILKGALRCAAAGRALAKALWANASVTSLDLCRADLDDATAAYVARATRAPGSRIVKLELDGNDVGPRACAELAEVLVSNGTLTSLSLEGNDLTRGGKLEKPFDGLCAALGKAKALTQLNLWRCGLSEAAGRTLAEGLRSNDLLILVETGGNDVLAEDQRDVDDTLRRNRDALDDRSTTAKAEARRRRTEAKERAVEEARREKAAEVDAWIEQRRGERKAAREKAALEAKKDEEEAAQRREAKERTRREMLEKQKSEGKKGGGKKKKK